MRKETNRINWPAIDTLMTDSNGNKIHNGSLVSGNKALGDSDKKTGKVYYNKHFAAFWVFACDESYNRPLNCGNWWTVLGKS